jgi:hypothetical protein
MKPFLSIACTFSLVLTASAQLTDVTQTPNTVNAGIRKSLAEQIGAGRGDEFTPGSSTFTICRDPFRAIMRGRQIFQRKFTAAQGLGPRTDDGVGDIMAHGAIGAGLSDSCAACHSRPRGSAGFGGNVFTRPESRDAPHLFGAGLVEMLGDEITHDLRAIRATAQAQASTLGHDVTLALVSKGIGYGSITAHADGTLDTSGISGVDADLRVRPFFAQGKTISLREFAVGAFNAEMGLQAFDRDLLAASRGHDVVTPAGMLLSGSLDAIEAPPAQSLVDDPDHDGVRNEVPTSLVDFLEFYLLNYFAPGLEHQTTATENGMHTLAQIGCTQCHVQDLWIDRDRRVADVHTAYDSVRSNGAFNHLFATATLRCGSVDDGSGLPPMRPPLAQPFLVRNIFADFRRHDLGTGFHERNFDGSVQTLFMTEPLWGVGSTPPYGHDGRSVTLEDVILRHGGEAQASRDAFAALSEAQRGEVLAFLNTLVLFGPPDTSSNLDQADPLNPSFPLAGHGSIDLSVLFLTPSDKE